MRQSDVVEAWADQRDAVWQGVRAEGPSLNVDDRPVACWIDRADESGAQIALYASKIARAWLRRGIGLGVTRVRGTLIEVPWPVPTPTSAQHAENLGYLMASWQGEIDKAARVKCCAWGHYERAQHTVAAAKLYAWAFDMPEPEANIPSEVLARARHNALAPRGKPVHVDSEAWRNMQRALWRGGRDIRKVYLGPVMLRLSSDQEIIETSEGEKVARADASAGLLWSLACDCRKRRSPLIWRVVSERPRTGRWSVQAIYADGSMQIGCHKVAFAEIVRLAVILGLR